MIRPRFALFSAGLFLLFALSAFGQNPAGTPEEDNDVVRIDTKLVQIEAIVKDKKGKIVKDLTAADFELLEDGKPRPVEFFSYVELARARAKNAAAAEIVEEGKGIKASEVKRAMVFIVSNPDLKLTRIINTNFYADITTISYKPYSARGLDLTEKFLNKFINESMSGNDLVSIVDTEANLGTLSNFTNDKEVLLAATKQIAESLKQGRYPTQNLTLYIRGGRDFEWDAGDLIQQNLNTLSMAESAVEQLQKVPGQKFIFLISRGMLGATAINGADVVAQRVKRVIEKANKAKVTFYSLGMRTLGEGSPEVPPPPGVVQSSDMMRQLAEKTGGRGIFNTNDLSVRFGEIMEENNGYYQLAFSPDDGTDPKAYQVKIKLKRPGLTAQYRSSVYQNGAQTAAPADPKERVLTLLRTPFASDAVKIKLGMSFRAMNKKQGTITTSVTIDPKQLEPKPLENGQREITLDLGIQVTEPDSLIARQEVKNFSLKVSRESWQQILKEGLVYQFETATRKEGAHLIKIAACINGLNVCGNSESRVTVK